MINLDDFIAIPNGKKYIKFNHKFTSNNYSVHSGCLY